MVAPPQSQSQHRLLRRVSSACLSTYLTYHLIAIIISTVSITISNCVRDCPSVASTASPGSSAGLVVGGVGWRKKPASRRSGLLAGQSAETRFHRPKGGLHMGPIVGSA